MINYLYAFLLGVVLSETLNIDNYFILFICLITLSMSFMIYKGQIKDINFYKRLMSFIIIMSLFYLGFLRNELSYDFVSPYSLNNYSVNLSGKIISIKDSQNGETIILKTEDKDIPYLSFENRNGINLELFDEIRIEGQTSIYNKNQFFEKEPLYFQYEKEDFYYSDSIKLKTINNLEIINQDKNLFESIIISILDKSKSLINNLNKYLHEPYLSISKAIVFGQSNNLLYETKNIFINSGLIHIMVLSGANISFIIFLIYYGLSFLTVKKRLIITILTSWLFIFVTGFTPPSTRAGIISTISIIANTYSKKYDAYFAIIFSLFVLAIYNPKILFYNASLHLSYLACFGLFVVSPTLYKYFKNKSKFKLLIITSFSILILTGPYILSLTGKLSLIGFVLTILVEPFVVLTTIFTFLTILFSWSNLLGIIISSFNQITLYIIYEMAKFGNNYFTLFEYSLSKNFLIIYYLLIFIVFVILKGRLEYKENEFLIFNYESKK